MDCFLNLFVLLLELSFLLNCLQTKCILVTKKNWIILSVKDALCASHPIMLICGLDDKSRRMFIKRSLTRSYLMFFIIILSRTVISFTNCLVGYNRPHLLFDLMNLYISSVSSFSSSSLLMSALLQLLHDENFWIL